MSAWHDTIQFTWDQEPDLQNEFIEKSWNREE